MGHLRITYTRQAKKALLRMQSNQAKRILTAIEKISEDPARRDLDVKSLTNRGGWRLRVGDYRILFDMDGTVLCIEKIAPRGQVYRA